jgi:hypothetical protein
MSDWFEFRPQRDDFRPSATDCSRFIEKPAGAHGFLRVEGERFVFADGSPARFFGAQIGWTEDRDELDYVARRLVKQGINVVRRHGMIGVTDRAGTSVLSYSAERWDTLDYMIHRLAQEGVYFILDVDYYLPVKPGEIDGLPDGGRTMHLMFFNEQARRLRWQRMEDVFTHVNPYSGKRYCDDPAIALVEVCNEDSLFWYSLDGLAEPFRSQLEQQFAQWLDGRHGQGDRAPLMQIYQLSGDYLREHADKAQYARDQMQFLYELEERYFTQTRDHLRRIDVKTPICGTNWQGAGFTTRAHLMAQAKLDYLDRHGYWDHPQGAGDTKWRIESCRFHNLPMVRAVVVGPDEQQENNVGNLVLAKAWERVHGMPMTITEWDTCLPNEHALEGTGLVAAYGMLQGWEAPMQFGYFSTDWRDELGPGSFDMLANPPQLLQFPAVATMWHRRDVDEAPVVADLAHSPEDVFGTADDRRPLPLWAAWVGKVGRSFGEHPRESVARDVSAFWDEETRSARSVTGQLCWNALDGLVTIDTPRTQAAVGFLSAGPVRLSSVELRTPTPFGAVYVVSLDDESPVAQSARLLICAVGPARNTDMQYEQTSELARQHNAPLWRLADAGRAPVLLQAVVGEVRVVTERAAGLSAWRLDHNGRRAAELPLERDADAVLLRMNREHEAVYYELAEQ